MPRTLTRSLEDRTRRPRSLHLRRPKLRSHPSWCWSTGCCDGWRRLVQAARQSQCGAIERQIAAQRPAHVKRELALKRGYGAHAAAGEVFVEIAGDYG